MFLDRLALQAKTTDYVPVLALHLLLSQGSHPMSPIRPTISNKLTSSILESVGIYLNASNEGYMERYIKYLQLKNILK